VYPGIPEHATRSSAMDGAPGHARPAAVPMPVGTSRYILALGTVEPRKDLPSLVRAFDRLGGGLRDVALVLAGSRGWGDEALASAVEASPWRDRIVRLGYIDDDAWGEVLTGASVLAYPSVYDGFGFPPLEAMVAGVPVVATSVGSIPEVTGDGAHLVTPGDADALAGGLVQMLSDADARAALVERGRARATLFTGAACGHGLAELYADAAEGR
jgi:glycosyltransferase involved in cell wall biosynthesis